MVWKMKLKQMKVLVDLGNKTDFVQQPMNWGYSAKAHRINFTSNLEVKFSGSQHWLGLLLPMASLLVLSANFIFSFFNVASALLSAYFLHRKGPL
jgi:hypothetical protein